MPTPDTGARAATRVLVICNLDKRLRWKPELMHSLNRDSDTGFDTGRFAHHIRSAASLLPQITAWVSIEPGELRFAEPPRARINKIAAAIAITSRRDGLLILDVDLAGAPAADDVAEFLHATWHGRFAMSVGGVPLLDWLTADLGHVTTVSGAPLAFGQNVHQCVFAGGRLARRLLRHNRRAGHVSRDVITVVFRGTITARRGSDLGVRRPSALNNSGETMVAHGRGVSLIVGWSEPVENAFGIAAAGLVSAAGVVSQVRLQSLDALTMNEQTAAKSPAEVSGLIETLANTVNQLRADLSFGIEAYADAVLIPELLIESYHSSLRQVAGLPDSLANTSRIVDRVAAVIASRHAALDASVQAYSESRAKVFATVVAIGTLLALPPTVLLAYFGTNSTQVSNAWSIFDLNHYGFVYLIVWIPFIVLVAGAAIVHRLIRPQMPEWVKATPGVALRSPAPGAQEQPVVVPRRVDVVDPPR